MTQEIIFEAPDQTIMAARYAVDSQSFRTEKPRPWSEVPFTRPSTSLMRRNFSVHPDGQRVVFANPRDVAAEAKRHFTLVSNFFDDLRRLAPGVRR